MWCIEQAECAEEVVDCLAESLSILEVGDKIPATGYKENTFNVPHTDKTRVVPGRILTPLI